MKPGSQFLVAARLLSTTPRFSAVLNLLGPAHQLVISFRETAVLGLEMDGAMPPEVPPGAQADIDKLLAFQTVLVKPEAKAALLGSVSKMLIKFFTAGLTKCELKARQYPEGLPLLTLFDLLRDYAQAVLNSSSFDDLLSSTDITFQLAPDTMRKSGHLAFSSQEGYLLSRLERPLSVAEIFSVVPGEEEKTKQTIMTLWAAGILNSQTLEKFIPKLPSQPVKTETKPAAEAVSFQSGSTSTVPEQAMDDLELVNHTYQTLAKKDFYTLLGVNTRAELPEIKVAYYKLAKRFHPDRFYGVSDEVVKERVDIIFSAINVAYETLKNAKARTVYDNAPVEQKKVASTNLVRGPQVTVDREEAMAKVAEDYYKRSQDSFDTGNYYQAVQFLRSATQIDPGSAKYWRQLGISLSKNPQWKKEAEDSFNRAMELDPKNPDNHLHLGFLYKHLGLKLRAKKHFASCLEMDPNNELALRELNLIDGEDKDQQKKGIRGMFKKKE